MDNVQTAMSVCLLKW